MNSEGIKTFLVLAETKSFNQTAELLYVSQPTVTARIKALESELGQKLFLRNSKQVELSPAGVHFLHYANDIFRAVSESQTFMKSYQQYRQQITVSAPVTNWDYLTCFRKGIISYTKEHPECYFHLHRAHSAETLERLSAGLVDLGLVYQLPSAPHVDAIPYHQERLLLVCAPGTPVTLRGNVAVGPDGPMPFVQLDFGSIINQLVEDMFYMLPSAISTNHPSTQLELIRNGFGIGLVQESAARAVLAAGELVEVRCEYNQHPLLYQSYLICDVAKRPQLSELIDYLLNRAT